jgi:hypothetical protein
MTTTTLVTADRSIRVEPQPHLLPRSVTARRVRLGSVAMTVAGLLFVAYPALRPFSDESSLQGAAAFGSVAWLAAHMLAMLAFILIAFGLFGLHLSLHDTAAESLSFWALIIGWIGIGLTLPFYGGEAFGLHAIGQRALADQTPALVSMADTVRSGAGLVMFLIGLMLLGAGAIIAATAVWKCDLVARWSGIPFAVAFALYIPQFFGSQPLRVGHGLLVAAGCLLLATGMWRSATDT